MASRRLRLVAKLAVGCRLKTAILQVKWQFADGELPSGVSTDDVDYLSRFDIDKATRKMSGVYKITGGRRATECSRTISVCSHKCQRHRYGDR